MRIEILKSKIHRAMVTGADLNYIGSITIDEDLMEYANLVENEKVDVLSITNGERLTTYVIKGKRGSGDIILNGAAAHKIKAGHTVIIVSYASIKFKKASLHEPTVILLKEDNEVMRFLN